MADPDKTPATTGGPPLPPRYGPPISLERARLVLAAAEAEAAANGWPVVIAIFDSAAALKLLSRMDQANIGAVAVAQRKAATAIEFRRATKVFEDQLITGGAAGLRMLSLGNDLVAVEGGLPLIERGEVVGAIGVSGMQPAQDGQVARAGARALTGG
jgi:uncharacterized protein GlcG (DUF336 family)